MQKSKVWIAISIILLILSIILGYNLYKQKKEYTLSKENDYNMAFYEVLDYVQNVKKGIDPLVNIKEEKNYGKICMSSMWLCTRG